MQHFPIPQKRQTMDVTYQETAQNDQQLQQLCDKIRETEAILLPCLDISRKHMHIFPENIFILNVCTPLLPLLNNS